MVLLPETWIGGSIDGRAMTSDTADDGVVFVPYILLGGKRDGWGPAFGLGWFRTDITADVFGQGYEAGNLRVRPYLVGLGYGVTRGRVRYEGSLVAGLAINHFGLSHESEQALRARDLPVDGDASNSLAVRPGFSVWIYVTPRLALRWHANYLMTRPDLTIGSGPGSHRFRQSANALTFGAGFAYLIHRVPAQPKK
ncbi:MAG: hypothetical protein GEV06_23810 [Luteitalea sp.]|nr:hypothetical protein [Luteitalea sp.]